jgi:glucosamine 6-phosphate synthetase-like amidotransferase/phosphosugar isomerase protein
VPGAQRSLSNHFRLRQELKREGIHFETDNDTEVAAGYLTWRLQQGDSLDQAWTIRWKTWTASSPSPSARATVLR